MGIDDHKSVPENANTDESNSESELQSFKAPSNLPAFWSKSPSLWFRHAELTMESARLTKDESKFIYIVRSLDQNLCQRVADIIMNPPATDKYNTLKELLIKRTEDSEMKRLETLFQTIEMGNQSPSSFYSQLIQIAGGVSCVSKDLVQKLWISRLPPTIAAVLMASGIDDVSKLLDSADNIWGLRNPSTNPFCGSMNHVQPSTSNANSSFNMNNLMSSINEIRSRLDKFESRFNQGYRPHSRSRSSNSRSRNRSQTRERPYVCWYHWKYGSKARKCKTESCTYKDQFALTRETKPEN